MTGAAVSDDPKEEARRHFHSAVAYVRRYHMRLNPQGLTHKELELVRNAFLGTGRAAPLGSPGIMGSIPIRERVMGGQPVVGIPSAEYVSDFDRVVQDIMLRNSVESGIMKYRVFRLCFIEGCSLRAAARRTDIRFPTVRQWAEQDIPEAVGEQLQALGLYPVERYMERRERRLAREE